MRTAANLDALCNELTRNYGDLFNAAVTVGLSLMFVTQWRTDDKDADARIVEAKRVGEQAIYSEIVRRGVHGVEDDVYYKGQVVGRKKIYSDGLLGKLAEAKLPEFAKGDSNNNTFNGPTQINIMPRAENYDQWLAMQRSTVEHAALEALEAPEDVIEGDFTVCKPEAHPLGGLGI